jgi:hypothetical protein
MAIWGYARSAGIGGQQHRIEAYASKRGMALDGVAIEQEGVSGVTPPPSLAEQGRSAQIADTIRNACGHSRLLHNYGAQSRGRKES